MTLGPDVRTWPADALEELAERSAIIEYLGKVPRARAEREAEAVVRARYAQQAPHTATRTAG